MDNEPSKYARQVAELVSLVEDFRGSKQGLVGRVELDEASVDLLVSALQDTNLQVRRKAVWVLGLVKSVRVIEPLLQYIKNPENLNRGGAVWAMGSIGDDAVVKPLVDALHDPDASVRSAAMTRLADRGEVSAVEPFLQAFRRILDNEESDSQLRWEIIMWIRLLSEKLNDKASFFSTIEALKSLKDDENPFMRKEASKTLEWLQAL